MTASMPMNVCANPEPGIETNGELKPVAIAFDSIVFPVPGAPSMSSPRSRFPPALSKASPDCQSVTTRRTSSFASAWPRTSWSSRPSLRRRARRPGSARCPSSAGAEEDREVEEQEERQRDEQRDDLQHERGAADREGRPRRCRAPRSRARQRPGTCGAQYQARRRFMTSSSCSAESSVPNRLGHGMKRRKMMSIAPRKRRSHRRRSRAATSRCPSRSARGTRRRRPGW